MVGMIFSAVVVKLFVRNLWKLFEGWIEIFFSVLVFKFLFVIWIKFLKDDLFFFLNLQKCWLDLIKSFFFVFLFDRFLPF